MIDDTVELLEQARRDGGLALQRLLDRHGPRLLARIRLMMGDQARARAESGDFLQGVFVRVLRDLDRFQPSGRGSFLRWATEIARNHIRGEVRRRREASLERFCSRSGSLIADGGSTPSAEATTREDVLRMIETLEELPAAQQRVIELRDFEQLSFEEVAQGMDRSVNAAQLLHARAVTALGAALRRRASAPRQKFGA